MSRLDPHLLMDLLAEAIELTGPQRLEFLDSSCKGQPELRRELEALLACEAPASQMFETVLNQVARADPQIIGAYELLEPVGEGGMAVVYKAQQHRPVKRLVAVKLIKLGMDTRQFVARFESERQALAMMDHPSVARVYDAGSTDTGRPYFVMEYVPGERLVQWCDRRNLSIRQRLELFIGVCEAVEHAHRKGIIHRDLKNSNVLVTDVDGRALPKVIDFGVAKAMTERLTDGTMFTEQGQLIGTPEYMSPEQAELGALGVDTRSDIYSLGVLLYELLAGVQPFASGTLRSGSYEQVQRLIREKDAPRPSSRLATVTDGEAIARRRRTELPTLIRNLRSELEWIPLKAMRKDREQRYRSAAELADDIRDYLSGRPLLAGPESARYRLRKFVRRHRAGVLMSAATLMLLLGGIFATSWQAMRANREADTARRQAELAIKAREEAQQRQRETRQVADFQSNMLREIDVEAMGRGIKQGFREQVRAAIAREYVGEFPNRRKRTDAEIDAAMAAYDEQARWAQPADVARRVIDEFVLERAGKTLDQEFADQPLVKADIMRAIGWNYWGLGLYGKAEPYLRTALKLRRDAVGSDQEEIAQGLAYLAGVLKDKGDTAAAGELYRESLGMYRRLHGDAHPHVAASLDNLGKMLFEIGEQAAAEPLLREALEMRRRLLGKEHVELAGSLNHLALLLRDKGDYAAAEPLFRESLAMYRKLLGDEHPFVAAALGNLAVLLKNTGDYKAAEALMLEALAVRRKVLGDEHPFVARALNNLGWLLDAMGEDARAEAILREALVLHRKLLGDEHPEIATSLNNLASLLQDKGDYAAAEPMYRESLAIYRKLLGDESAYVATGLNNLASLLQDKGDLAAAEPLFRQALSIRRKQFGDEHWLTLSTCSNLGYLLRAANRPLETIALLAPLEQAQRRSSTGANSVRLGRFLATLGRARVAVGDYDAAEADLIEADAILKTATEATPRYRIDALSGLVDLYEARHAADPRGGFDLKATQTRGALNELATTLPQPTNSPATTHPAP